MNIYNFLLILSSVCVSYIEYTIQKNKKLIHKMIHILTNIYKTGKFYFKLKKKNHQLLKMTTHCKITVNHGQYGNTTHQPSKSLPNSYSTTRNKISNVG